VTALPPKFGNIHDLSVPPSHNRLIYIGGVKLAGMDRLSFDAIIHANHTHTHTHTIKITVTQQTCMKKTEPNVTG